MEKMTFWGYRRPDGRVGIRNKILILPASVCASDTTRIIASQVESAVTFNNQNGCSHVPSDQQFTMDVMAGYAANPNVYGTVVVSLGCENCQMDLVLDAIKERTNKPIRHFIIQENGGTISTVEKAVRAAKEMAQEASLLQKEEFDFSELIIGTECGGSDPTSGLAANVLIGEMSDRMVELGGTSILSETTEFIGAEHILARRGKTKEISDRIYQIVHDYEHAIKLVGHDIREGNPSPGNKKGGISSLEDKSLGCTQKSGSAPVMGVLSYGEPVKEKGLNLLSAPGNDLVASTALAASGAHIVLFTTGRGTPFASPVPTVKISTNNQLAKKKQNWIDFNCGVMVNDTPPDELSENLLDFVLEIASGKKSKSEEAGFHDMAIFKQGVTL